MSFLSSGTNISSNLATRYQTGAASFSAGGTANSTSGYNGRIFTSSDTLTVSVPGRYMALVINAGYNGEPGNASIYPSGGNGGAGGSVKVIYGFLNLGNYTVQIFTGGGQATTFTPTTITSTITFTPGSGGVGYEPAFNYTPATVATAGGTGPTINIAPFTSVSASGGGGGGVNGTGPGEASTKNGGPAIGKTGGTPGTGGGTAAATSYGSGGGGGYGYSVFDVLYLPGGTGGPGYFWIVGHAPAYTSTVTTGTEISNTYLVNSSYTLNDVIDNYLYSYFNPNTTFLNIPCIDQYYLNTYTLGTTLESLVSYYNTSLGIGKFPVIITSSTAGASYYANYFNNYFTMAFMTNGATYTMFTTKIVSFDVIVVGNGGNGGDGPASGRWASGGGAGGALRRSISSLSIGTTITIRTNSSATYGGTTRSWGVDFGNSSYIAVDNGTNGRSNQATSAAATTGTIGLNSTNGMTVVTMTNTFGGYVHLPTANTTFNNGFGVSATYTSSGTTFGGSGSGAVNFGNLGKGGFYGTNAGATTNIPIGFGAGGGVSSTQSASTPGASGIILMSFFNI